MSESAVKRKGEGEDGKDVKKAKAEDVRESRGQTAKEAAYFW
jgi:hypothetical protein